MELVIREKFIDISYYYHPDCFAHYVKTTPYKFKGSEKNEPYRISTFNLANYEGEMECFECEDIINPVCF